MIGQSFLGYVLLSNSAYPPIRGTPGAAGIDLRSPTAEIICAKANKLIDLKVQLSFPEGCYGRLASRSSLSAINNIHVGAGVVDADYQGSVKVLLMNFSDKDFKVKEGMPIVQLICERISQPEIQEIKEKPADTIRGEAGFGSTDERLATADSICI